MIWVKTRVHSNRMHTVRSSSHLGVSSSVDAGIPPHLSLNPTPTPQTCSWRPLGLAWDPPPARPLNFPTGYGPGTPPARSLNLSLGMGPPWTEWQTSVKHNLRKLRLRTVITRHRPRSVLLIRNASVVRVLFMFLFSHLAGPQGGRLTSSISHITSAPPSA